jgi:hypothetical protein
MLHEKQKGRFTTYHADKAYDARDFVKAVRGLNELRRRYVAVTLTLLDVPADRDLVIFQGFDGVQLGCTYRRQSSKHDSHKSRCKQRNHNR